MSDPKQHDETDETTTGGAKDPDALADGSQSDAGPSRTPDGGDDDQFQG